MIIRKFDFSNLQGNLIDTDDVVIVTFSFSGFPGLNLLQVVKLDLGSGVEPFQVTRLELLDNNCITVNFARCDWVV